MTRMPKHLVGAAALLGAAALTLPALAQGGGDMTRRRGAPASWIVSGTMDRGLVRQGMSGGCSQMVQGMRDGAHGGRPNQQWRHPLPAPGRG
jgi:hypothetical protein